MSWGSDLLGDDFDGSHNFDDVDRDWVMKQLYNNPVIQNYKVEEREPVVDIPTPKLDPVLLDTDGWFNSRFDKDANQMVKDLRYKRRMHKQYREEIDSAIDLIRGMKKMEIESVLSSLPWASNHLDSIKSLGLNERNLKSLRKHGITREVSLKQACLQWENANDVISKLSQIPGEFSEEQASLWEEALEKRDTR